MMHQLIYSPQYKEEEDFILYFYDKMFSHYPFYNDNDLKKEYKLAQYKKIRQEGTSIQVKLDSLSTFLKTFDDSHLYIPKTEREHLSGPVRLYKILDEIYIAAVFDTTLVLKPGMKLLKIDQKPVQSILDSTIACFHGNYRLRQQKAISNLLRRAKNDSCILTVQDETDKVSQHIIKYNRPLFIPDNFLHENLEVKRINKSTTYVFVKEFYLGSFLHLLNYKNLLEETNNLILDFRNNNRGVGIELIRWASLFIRKPTVFEHEIFQWDDDNQIKESLIIKPNRYLYLGCKNIIVLINGKTECASELLIGFLKDKTNAFVVGNENTSGELAAAGFITLKSNRKLFLNSDVKKLLSDKTSVRQEGIEPDVWVSINCIEDLAPYNDKILTIALKMTIDQENGN
ncbi:MAG: S41 family peptidase [Mangrovibacterium sp.]